MGPMRVKWTGPQLGWVNGLFLFNLILADCHTPVEWHKWTGEKRISQMGAVLDLK